MTFRCARFPVIPFAPRMRLAASEEASLVNEDGICGEPCGGARGELRQNFQSSATKSSLRFKHVMP
jgi:hypothetical protein